jgi:MFS transporter, SP family, sugar:H+ symporter
MDYVIHTYTGLPYSDKSNADLWTLPASKRSLIVSILSAGTFFGALFAGDCADFFGRRTTVIGSCLVFLVGVIMQVASTEFKLLVAGRAIGGLGVGGVSCTMSVHLFPASFLKSANLF